MLKGRRIGWGKLFYTLCLCLWLSFVIVASPAYSKDRPENPIDKKNVLILNAFESNIPAFEKTNQGLSQALQAGGIGIRNQFYENLDLVRNPGPEHRRLLVELLHQRHDRRKVDFIITLYPEALKFLLQEGRRISADAPVMALFLPAGFEPPATERRIISHLVVPDLTRTLEIALGLVPEAKRVYMAGGSHPLNKWLENLARRDFKKYEGRLNFQYLSDLAFEEIIATVAEAPPDSIVFITAYGQDINGKYQTTVDFCRRLAPVSTAPAFGILDTLIGKGILGGSLISFEQIGNQAGQTVAEILNGARSVENLPDTWEAPQVDMFDWNQLERWNLSESDLPRGSVVINREFSLWDLKYYIIGGLAFISLQSLLIAVLLAQRRRSRKAEASLRQKTEELDRFFNVSLDLHCTATTNGYFLLLNPAWEKILGYGREELTAHRFLDFVHPDDLARTRDAMAALASQRKVTYFENRYRCRDGSYRWLEWNAAPAGNLIYAAARDITDRLKAEAEARQRRDELAHITRVAAMGELTTSLAHEINQPLTAILSNAEAAHRFLSRTEPDIDEVRQILDDIIRDDKRASDVVRKTRALLKREAPRHEPVDLNQAIQEVAALVRGEALMHGLNLTTELNQEIKQVHGDHTELLQVMLNLILNSASAMTHLPHSQRRIVIASCMADRSTLKVSVSDRGTGIDPAAIDRLFEPFYTTKAEGMGMGLAICQRIIEDHGGAMQATNNPEGGATFGFTLPAIREDVS